MSSGDIGRHCGSFFVDGQRLKAKQRSAGATKEEKENNPGWGFGLWTSANSYVFPISGRDVGQMNVRTRWEERKAESAALLPDPGLVKFKPAAETGCGSHSVPRLFCFNVWFWERLVQHLETLYKPSGEFPFLLSCKCFQLSSGRCGASDINTFDCVLDKDSSEASALVNTISEELCAGRKGGARFGLIGALISP